MIALAATDSPETQGRTNIVEQTTVFIRQLRIEAMIGVHPHERESRQPLLVDLDIDVGEIGGTDLSDTLDYCAVAAEAQNIADRGHIDLVETFASRLADAILSHRHAIRVRIGITKPGALAALADGAGCEIIKRCR